MLRLRTNVTASPTASERRLVGDVRDLGEVGAARAEQGDDLVDADLFAGEHAVEHLADRACGARAVQPGSGRPGSSAGGATSPPARPVVVAGQALGVGGALHREAHVGVQPALGVAHVLGVDGEARRERLAHGLGRVARARRARATAARGSRGRG